MNLWIDGPSISWKFSHLESDIVSPFLAHLLKLLVKIPVDRIGIFWDHKRSARRLALWPKYKMNRTIRDKKSPEEVKKIHEQMDLMREGVFPALGIPQIRLDGHEADDLIYAATQSFQKGSTMILTTDKDFVQLVSQDLTVLLDRPGSPVTVSPRTIRKLFRVQTAAQYLLYRVLTGDPSDWIPGIGGVGEVTARKILGKCTDLEDLLERREELREDKDFEKVFRPEALENLIRNWKLMALSCGEGSEEQVIQEVMTRVLDGAGQASVRSVIRSLKSLPGVASEVISFLPQFDQVYARSMRLLEEK